MLMQAQGNRATSLYLDLMKGCLTRELFPDGYVSEPERRRDRLQALPRRLLSRRSVTVRHGFDPQRRSAGRDWPIAAETMIGRPRLDNIEHCLTDVLRDDVPGDVIETGVWRGGATIFMKAVLEAYGDDQRTVWLADSFEGLPRPDAGRYPADRDDRLWTISELAVSLDEVKANFARYGLLDDRVRFLVGWFRDTLPSAPIERLAVLRLDGDMYESTMDSLRHLYPRLSVGGYVIVDDYGAIEACRAAVEDYRTEQGITDQVVPIDWSGVYWRRTA